MRKLSVLLICLFAVAALAAKLQPAIHQAISLGLLDAPPRPQGSGGGPGGPGAGAMAGMRQ